MAPLVLLLAPQNDRWPEVETTLHAAGYRLYPLTPVDAGFGAGDAPPARRDFAVDGPRVPEMAGAVADVDVVAVHRDLLFIAP